MPQVEETFRDWLVADSGVTSLVGTRIYPVVAPNGADLPFCVFTKVSDVPVVGLDTASEGVRFARIQVSCFGDRYSEAKDVAEAIRQALDGNGSAVRDNALDLYDEDTRTHYEVVDYMVAHSD